MGGVRGFDKASWPLAPVRVERWEGFVFVNLDPDAVPLGPRLRPLSTKYRRYRMSEMRDSGPLVFWNDCNWKLAVENGVDMYHVPWVHPGPSDFYDVPGTTAEEDPNGFFTTSVTPTVVAYPNVTGTNLETSPFPALDGLPDEDLRSFHLLLVYPTSLFALIPDGLAYLFFFPEGPMRTRIEISLCYPPSTMALPDFPEGLRAARDGFVATNDQDMEGCRAAQRGLASAFARPGRYSRLEATTWHFDRWVLSRVFGGADSGSDDGP
jgi:phenylpropionate dioxygenase-like ring-hydroxylating dioxygenase large terminal subunit